METEGRIPETLIFRGYQTRLFSFSALDKYLGFCSLPFVFVETAAGIAELARYTDDLFFPGTDMADAAADSGGRRFYFRCRDSSEPPANPSFGLLSLAYDCKTRRFLDTREIYPVIRSFRNSKPKNESAVENVFPWWENFFPETGFMQAIFDASLVLARYEPAGYPPKSFTEVLASGIEGEPPPCIEMQRALLTGLMSSPGPDRGLELLKKTGFLQKYWPEIYRLDSADHSKEYHPEGNAWKHTLQTFEHRKRSSSGEYDLRLSLALLLHDIGKPMAEGSGSRRFDGHAEIGARAASRFLERLGFGTELAGDVYYLVKNHMLPAALARLSLNKTGDIMNSPLFPSLMELYRCDESSSFKGLDGFYANSAAYQAYLRNMRNPYRNAGGKIFNSARRH